MKMLRPAKGAAALYSRAIWGGPTMIIRRTFVVLAALVCGSLTLSACSTTGTTGGATSGGATPGGATTSHGNGVTVTPGDTSLCDIVSVAEFNQAVGGGVAKLNKSSVKAPNGAVQVNCAYLPASLPGSGGAIIYAITSDGPTYYAHVKLDEQDQLNSVNDVSGMGDAAFWGTDKGSTDILNLDMLKDNVVAGITMDGSAQDGSAYLPAAEQMAKEIAPRL